MKKQYKVLLWILGIEFLVLKILQILNTASHK